MRNLDRYKGIFPAFYACYDDDGKISPERIRVLARYFKEAGVNGLYVGGSSGECIYQSVEERKLVLETVIDEVGEDLVVIAHVAANNTHDSVDLAQHSEQVGADAIAAIPPIYFILPEYSIEEYWGDIADATNLDFFIYNIPALSNYALSLNLFEKLLERDNVIGVKNSSMPVQDIYAFKNTRKKDVVVFNGPDEQFVSGLLMGADGGIGGTYGAMPELFLAAERAVKTGDNNLAKEIQYSINQIIFSFFKCKGNMYSVIKEILRRKGIEVGEVRKPLSKIYKEDHDIIDDIIIEIEKAYKKYVNKL